MLLTALGGEVKKKVQWNAEVNAISLSSTQNEPCDGNSALSAACAYEKLMSCHTTTDTLLQHPFTSLSMSTLSLLRDDAYKNGCYDFSEEVNSDILSVCMKELGHLWKRTHGYCQKVHASCFRPVVLLSLLSPVDVVRAIFEHISEPKTETSAVVSFTFDALIACGNALTYRSENGSSLVCLTMVNCVISKAAARAQNTQILKSSLIKLLGMLLCTTKQDGGKLMPLESCTEHVIKPLMGHCTSIAADILLVILKIAKNEEIRLPSQAVAASLHIVHDLCQLIALENRLLVGVDEPETLNYDNDKNILSLESLAQYLPSDLLRLALRENKEKDTWTVAIRLLPFVASPKEVENCLREEIMGFAAAVQASRGSPFIKPHEQMVVFCATAPTFPIEFKDLCSIQAETLDEREVGKWIAALARQLTLLTAQEVRRLLNGRLGFVLQPLSSRIASTVDENRICAARCTNVFALQLTLQATGLILSAPKLVEKGCGSTDVALRICREVRAAVCDFLRVEPPVDIGFCGRQACVHVLLLFVVGAFHDDQLSDSICEPCIDVITMSVLESVQKIAQVGRANDNGGQIDAIAAAIKDVYNYSKKSQTVCAAALEALRTNS